MNKIFSQTVTASQLRDKLKDFLSNVTGEKVLQIIHRGQPIRVLMTQEHYLNLLGKIASYERASGETVPHRSAEEIGSQVIERAEQLFADEEPKRGKRVNG